MGQVLQINESRLYALTNSQGSLHRIKQDCPGGNLMTGSFVLSQQYSGIWLHASRVQELQNAYSTFERPAGLSFTYMLEGELEFSIAGKSYRFASRGRDRATRCSTICLSRKELMTRKIRSGAYVDKINISVDKTWLESRLANKSDRSTFNLLFRNQLRLLEWESNPTVDRLIHKLRSLLPKKDLLSGLEMETLVTELLHRSLEQLIEVSKNVERRAQLTLEPEFPPTGKHQLRAEINSTQSAPLRNRIDTAIEKHNHSLASLAFKLNMSVSTLQRRFKTAYGMTVIEYIRSSRLERAKSRLLLEEISISEAAQDAGYEHTANFVTAFRKAFGMTPGVYLKQVRG